MTGVLALATPVIGAVAGAPRTGQVAVFFDPRDTSAELMTRIAQTDARLVRLGGLPGTVIVDMSDADRHAALRAVGALLIADPIVLGGCSISQQKDLTA